MIPPRLTRHEEHLARLRDTSGYRINRAPWGWTAYRPGKDEEIQAKNLDELERKIMPPAGGDGDPAPRSDPPAGP